MSILIDSERIKYITIKSFDRLKEEYLQSDIFEEGYTNYPDVDSAFLNYCPNGKHICIEVEKWLGYMDITSYHSNTVRIPYDCKLFWLIYYKIFKGED